MTTENQVLADAVAEARKAEDLDHALKGVHVSAGATYQQIDLEQYRDHPRRFRGSFRLDDVASFCGYLNYHSPDGIDCEVWARDPDEATTILAVLNSHGGEPGHGDWRATLTLKPSPEWQEWTAGDGQALTQTAFAHLIERQLSSIVEPASADMLEMALSFEATKGVQFRSGTRLDSGQRQLTYEETITARAGQTGQLTIPETFKVAVAPFRFGKRYPLEARLRYRINDGELRLVYELIEPHVVLEAAYAEIIAEVEKATDLTVLRGYPG